MKIEVQNLNAGYGDLTIIRNVNLTLEGPGLTCIIGPNGVGKSTLVKCLNKLLTPQSGRVLVNGRDVAKMSRKEIAEIISYVPVQMEDLFSMPVFDSVLIGRANKSKWGTSREDVVKVNRILEVLGLTQFADRPTNQLSAGQCQTVAIARGMVQETEIVILDEPTSNLDIRHQIFITSLMHHVALIKNVMVVMISHNLNIASMFADNIVLMSPPGIIADVGYVEEVITSENISKVYNVDCDIVQHKGRPVMLLDPELH